MNQVGKMKNDSKKLILGAFIGILFLIALVVFFVNFKIKNRWQKYERDFDTEKSIVDSLFRPIEYRGVIFIFEKVRFEYPRTIHKKLYLISEIPQKEIWKQNKTKYFNFSNPKKGFIVLSEIMGASISVGDTLIKKGGEKNFEFRTQSGKIIYGELMKMIPINFELR